MSWRQHAGLISIAVSLLIVTVLVRQIDPVRVVHVLGGVDWRWIALAFAIRLGTTGVDSVRWTLLASSIRRHLLVRSAFKGFLGGMLGNIVLPMKLGDGVRAYVYTKAEGVPFASALSTVLLDRMTEIASYLVFLAATAAVFPLPRSVIGAARWLLAGLLACLAALMWISSRRHRRRRAPPDSAPVHAQGPFDRFASGLAALRSARLFPLALATGVVSWLTKAAVAWSVMQGFHLPLPLVSSAVIVVMVNIAIAVVGTPGNVGPFEASAVAALRLFRVPEEEALGFALVFHLADVAPVAVTGLGMLALGRLTLERPPEKPSPT